MDVQAHRLTHRQWSLWLFAILALGFALRLHGIHDPVLDHPGWRQGDTASIARNFATQQYNIFFPQTNYDGPPPNYVELELQIVPFLAATLYKVFGVHAIIGRFITIGFSLGTVAVLASFGRWLFAEESWAPVAGLLAALFYAVMPGSIYYGRTFTPDTAMVFFSTAALFVIARLLTSPKRWSPRRLAGATALLALAFLAKPVSLVLLVPIVALLVERAAKRLPIDWAAVALMILLPLGLLYGYDRIVSSHAEWHWASGIVRLHVVPAMVASLRSVHGLHVKLSWFRIVLGMLARTMIGPAFSALALVGFLFMPAATRSRTLLWSWLAGALAYTYAVVTVERVDYYLYLFLPLAALAAAGFSMRLTNAIAASAVDRRVKWAAVAAAAFAVAAVVEQNRQIVAPYYHYSRQVYRNATALNATLAPGALVVMGHYDPSILYYIGRYGWEEDPYLWTPFDEQSAIRKGARYFIDIEKNRFAKNVELCAWMQRFPILNPEAQWPVYETDEALVKPGAEALWRSFRTAERAGRAREWLAEKHLCGPPATAYVGPHAAVQRRASSP